jgi:hypothetical protein
LNNIERFAKVSLCGARLILSLVSRALPGLKLGILPAESLNTTSRIYQFLFPGKKWMALGANLNPNIFLGGARLHHVAARAMNSSLKILGMYVLLHLSPPNPDKPEPKSA